MLSNKKEEINHYFKHNKPPAAKGLSLFSAALCTHLVSDHGWAPPAWAVLPSRKGQTAALAQLWAAMELLLSPGKSCFLLLPATSQCALPAPSHRARSWFQMHQARLPVQVLPQQHESNSAPLSSSTKQTMPQHCRSCFTESLRN